MAVPLTELNQFLSHYLRVDHYPDDERGGVYHPSNQLVSRLGVALEPSPDLSRWVAAERLDALWLHRPWQLANGALPPATGVLYQHLPFDETLTMGFNRPLAQALGMAAPEELGHKQGRAIGMIGQALGRSLPDWEQWAGQAFGGYDQLETGRQTGNLVAGVAVVGAMNDALVYEAADRGAGLYLTGQYRKAAQKAVDETGIAVVAVGHRRSEEWGLRVLATLLQNQFPTVNINLKESGHPLVGR